MSTETTTTPVTKKAAKKKTAKPTPLKFKARLLATDLLDKRAAKNLSYRDISGECGLNEAVVHRVASQKTIQIDTLVAIVNWLHKPISRYF